MIRHNELIAQQSAHDDIHGVGDWARTYPTDAAELRRIEDDNLRRIIGTAPRTALAEQIRAAAACIDDLASGTLSAEDLMREREAARAHVARLYALAEVLPGLQAAAGMRLTHFALDNLGKRAVARRIQRNILKGYRKCVKLCY